MSDAHAPKAIMVLSLVVPVFNEEAVIPVFCERIDGVFAQHTGILLEIIFVNDGSTDGTLACLLEKQRNDPRIVVVDLSRNFGKEAALSAGLKTASGEVVVPLDADLQDPPELIPAMFAKWREGYEVVLGRRTQRNEDFWGRRISARWFYRLHNLFSELKLPENVGDFRLLDRRVVDALNTLPESCRFMKGLFAWVGFRTAHIDYVRPGRAMGTSKFNAWRLWNFALDGITSFSTIPLRIWTYMGFALALTALGFAVSLLLRVLISGVDVPGYASLMIAVVFFGGLQLIGIGILGEYVGRNYLESKRRPAFVVRKTYRV